MFDTDLVVSFVLIALLFLRQVAVAKLPNKLNYAPLIIGVGVVSALIHLLIKADDLNFVLVFKEALFPLLVSFLLFIIANILHQSNQNASHQNSDTLNRTLIEQMMQTKQHMRDLELKFSSSKECGESNQDEIKSTLKDDMEELKDIKENQRLFLENQQSFLEKFEIIFAQQEKVMSLFEDFTTNEMPNIDTVIHRHIDMLRISEKDHFNKVSAQLVEMNENRDDRVIVRLHEAVIALNADFKNSSALLVQNASGELNNLVQAYERSMTTLRAQSESVSTRMSENETILDNVRTKSELLMNQLILSSTRMEEVAHKSEEIDRIVAPFASILSEVQEVRTQYLDAKARLGLLSSSLQEIDEFHYEKMRGQIENLSETLGDKIDKSLSELHEHFHIAQKEISPSVQELALRKNIQNSYGLDADNN